MIKYLLTIPALIICTAVLYGAGGTGEAQEPPPRPDEEKTQQDALQAHEEALRKHKMALQQHETAVEITQLKEKLAKLIALERFEEVAVVKVKISLLEELLQQKQKKLQYQKAIEDYKKAKRTADLFREEGPFEEPDHGRIMDKEIHEIEIYFNDLKRKAGTLHEVGRHDDAEEVERKAHEVERILDRLHRNREEDRDRKAREFEEQVRQMQHKAETLHAVGEYEAAKLIKMKIDDAMGKLESLRHGEDALEEEFAELERRIHHVVEAAENLHAAGLHDHAEELEREAEGFERELNKRAMHRHLEELPIRFEELAEMVHGLRCEMQELKTVIMDLRKRVDNLSAPSDTRSATR